MRACEGKNRHRVDPPFPDIFSGRILFYHGKKQKHLRQLSYRRGLSKKALQGTGGTDR
jgi:hypothetical protein